MERTEHTDQSWVEGRDSTFYLGFTENARFHVAIVPELTKSGVQHAIHIE